MVKHGKLPCTAAIGMAKGQVHRACQLQPPLPLLLPRPTSTFAPTTEKWSCSGFRGQTHSAAQKKLVELANWWNYHGMPPTVTELPSTPKIKQQSSITNPHSETGHFHIKSMPKCGKSAPLQLPVGVLELQFFSPVVRVVLLQKGGSPPQTPHLNLEGQFTPMQ